MKNAKTHTAAILLAGGIGNRMGAEVPKQFLKLCGKPLIRYSFDVLMKMAEISEVIVVCQPEFQHLFDHDKEEKQVKFASPGKRRQDSVFNGLQEASKNSDFVCIHDGARPFIDSTQLENVLESAKVNGAATLGLPIKFTVKEVDRDSFVVNTPDRSLIWEIQTPQVINYKWLIEGFDYVKKNNLDVTDDTSLVEQIGKQVKLVHGSHMNIKITFPEDLALAEHFCTFLHARQ